MTHVKFTPEDLIDHDAIGAVFRDSRGRVLTMRHLKWNFWTIPLGKAHPGQSPQDGLVEEMYEELGVRVLASEQRTSALIRYTDDRDVLLRFHILEVTEYSGEIANREPSKHADLGFVELALVAEKPLLSDGTILFLNALGVECSVAMSGFVVS
jgi:8-oxo-dGTP pyrophosphatase MutT (NUDIX family)